MNIGTKRLWFDFKSAGRFWFIGFFLAFHLSAFAAPPVITTAPTAQTIFIGDSATFSVTATGTAPLSYQWLRDGAEITGEMDSALIFSTAAADDGALYSVRVSNADGSITSDSVALSVDFGMPGPVQTNRLVGITEVWKYNVDKIDLGSTWSLPSYSDTAWASGGGLLYVESSDLPAAKTTALPLVANNLPMTCYFRAWFTNDINAELYSLSLVANTVVDDGVVVYLNGAEVLRNRMGDGTIFYDTKSPESSVGNAGFEGPFYFSTDSLVDGENLLAVEVHQTATTSSDIVMGLTLDLVWTERIQDTAAPEILTTLPASGSSVTNLTQVEITFSEEVQGIDAADLLINGVPASSMATVSTSEYSFQFAEPANGVVNISWASGHGITDLSPYAYDFSGTGFSVLLTAPLEGVEELKFTQVSQSSDFSASTEALHAADGSETTYSLTQDLPGSTWMAALGRPFELAQIQLVNRFAPDDTELDGCTLSVLNMDDQVVFETVLSNLGSGGIILIDLPEGTVGRAVRIGLSDTETNGAGTYRVGLSEVRLYGSPQISYMPEPYVEGDGEGNNVEITGLSVSQTTDYSSAYGASKAIDGDTETFTHTDKTTLNNYWIATLSEEGPIARVELVNRDNTGSDSRMDNLVIRILDEAMNSVATKVTSNPGEGGTYTFNLPDNTTGRYVKVGLENGEPNGYNDYVVQLAEVRIYSEAAYVAPPQTTPNLASFKRSYMLRLTDSLAPASQVNDDDLDTEASTTTRTVDGYWEVDLGETFALYGVRAVSAAAIGDNLEGTVCRLFDENHDSVFEKNLTGSAPVYDVDLDGPIFARYVRVGLEDKTWTDGNAGGFIGFSEVEVFGRPEHEVGILSFSASDTTVSSGQGVTLDWSLEDVMRAEIFPNIGSVGSQTDTNGIGSIVQNMTESTEFILVATNNAGIFTRAVGVEVNGDALPVVISEVLADNKYSLEDGYGDAPDWIEIRNTGNSSVDLTGWGLSDKADELMQWVFPSTTIAPHSTLIVFASKNDASLDPQGYLHADFKLSDNGDSVYLTKPDGVTLVDSLVDFPALDTDLAYGRDLDGSWMFMEPTPNAANTDATYGGWLKSLDWSHARGFYETNFTLTVTSENPEATILYSLDGSVPSNPYMEGINITGTETVRIQAVHPGYKPARIQTKTFIFVDDVITSSVMDTGITADPSYAARMKPGLLALPTISIVLPTTEELERAIVYDEQACSIEILWPNGESSPVQEDCGIARFGGAYGGISSSGIYAKRGLSLSFSRTYGNGKLSAPLFNGFDRGVLAKTSFDKLHLRGGNHDTSDRGFSMSDRFIQDSYLDMGSLNPHGRFVHVYLNGVYWGNYNCKEVLNESFLADYLGGESEDYVSVKGNDNIGGSFVIGAGDPPNPEPWERVRNLGDDFEAVSPYLDVSHYIDFMLLWGYGNNESEFRACGPKEAGSGHKFWINDPDGFLRDTSDDRIISQNGPGTIWSSLLGENHPDFKMLLADRIYMHYFNNGALTPAHCDARLVARMDEIRDSYLAESARWGFLSPADWESKAETIRTDMFPYRTDELIVLWRAAGFLPSFDPPTFNQYGGAVLEGFKPVLTSSDGTIYYTLDGTDPRLPGGAINSAAALIWTAGAVTVTEDITITCRVRTSSGEWSALAEPRFLLGSRQSPMAGELVISEINYNPDGPDDYEFIEIWNSGTNLLDLSGVNISNAVRYIFPDYTTLYPGAHRVIVEDEIAFSDRYQTASSPWYWNGIDVAGEWIGGLSDGGERIAIVSADGTQLSSVRYRSDGDWPERPDGGGSSLEIRDPDSIPTETTAQSKYFADGRNWTASSLYHGSPGRFDAGSIDVVINEVLAHTDVGVDWIELYNSGMGVADLSNMAITDHLDLPARYLISNGTTIDGDGYIKVTDLGFGFSELGSDAYLLELSGTNIVRIVDGVSFPAVEREEPFGRHTRSDGIVDFTELDAITPGAANVAPRVGPVVISEIMFVPTQGRSEYVEIHNISDATVSLYDESIPTHTWSFSGVGDFDFPEGTTLAPNETAILCATNPATFRSQYGVDASISVFGPWTGGLALEGEKLQLLYPGDPEQDGFVPMYRADHVSFRTNAYWTVANTGGISLERRTVDGYGNDPISWRSSIIGGSPGFILIGTYPMGTTIQWSGGSTIIAFEAIPGQSYEVRYTDSLTEPDWQPLKSAEYATSQWVEVIDSAPTNSVRYYQIIWNH